MHTGNGSSNKQGATLIEVLVALGIATLIISVVVTTHITLTRHASEQADALRENDRLIRTSNELQLDLYNLYVPENDSDCSPRLAHADGRLLELSFCRWRPASGMYPVLTNPLERVTYTLGERKGKPALLKTIEALAGPNALKAAVTNWIETGWPNLRIELRDGETWRQEWSGDSVQAGGGSGTPHAARIHFLPEGAEATDPFYETVIVIPAGMSTESRQDED